MTTAVDSNLDLVISDVVAKLAELLAPLPVAAVVALVNVALLVPLETESLVSRCGVSTTADEPTRVEVENVPSDLETLADRELIPKEVSIVQKK